MAPHRVRASRHGRLHAGHRHEALALDAQPPADRHRRRRRQALPQEPPGRDLPAGRRALLAAGRAAVHPRRDRTRREGRGQSRRWPTACRASWTSSPTSATCKAPARPAKSAASAPNWCTATTGTRPGTRPVATPATRAEELESLEGIIPGIDGSARACADVTEANEAHPLKAGPCVKFTGLEAVRPPARQAGRLPDRRAPGQGPRRRGADQGDDPGGAGLPGVSAKPPSQPSVERQRMDVDIVCVGFGPATAGFLTTLSQATREPGWHAGGRKRRHAGHAAAGALLRTRR